MSQCWDKRKPAFHASKLPSETSYNLNAWWECVCICGLEEGLCLRACVCGCMLVARIESRQKEREREIRTDLQ